MDLSDRLGLSYVMAAQAQKHVTVNETFRRLDALVQLTVLSASIADQPESPAPGEAYILPAAKDGAQWADMEVGSVAVFQDNAWVEIAAQEGLRAFVTDISTLMVYDGADWSDLGGATISPAFGEGPVVNTDYITSKGVDLITNGTGFLGNDHNFNPFEFDGSLTPGLPGAFRHTGYYPGVFISDEFIAVNPNDVYATQVSLYQDEAPEDWSGFANEDRHLQYMGIVEYDVDLLQITPLNHARYRSGSTDSYTTLVQPLTPGDTVIHLESANGWNDTEAAASLRGIQIFEYKNSLGFKYDFYTRIQQSDLFELSGVDKSADTITLNQGFPASMGNPDDPAGTWPVGTRIANSMSGSSYKYCYSFGVALAQNRTWYKISNYIGGVDTSGKNVLTNFSPGSANVKLMWLPNFSNRPGGYSTYPDTGAAHAVRFAGVSLMPEPQGVLVSNADGSQELRVPKANLVTNIMDVITPSQTIEEV